MPDAGAGAAGGLVAHLTPYQVALCSLLVQYASDGDEEDQHSQDRLFELLLKEVQVARGSRQTTLFELQEDLNNDADGMAVWEVFISRLTAIDSPDALFDTFHDLEAAISREVASTSPLHAGGIFGHLARRCVLTFKEASFEAIVKLYDAVRQYIEAFETQNFNQRARRVSGEQDGDKQLASGGEFALGTSQMEHLAQDLMHDLPLSFGRVPFPIIDSALAALQGKLPLCHVVEFLRYINSMQHRLADDAGSCLRSFHDSHQQRGLAEMRTASGWSLGVPPEDGLPDLIQHASLALAGLHSEMRHVDDALQAIGESIRAAQEASDGSCLCACLYMMSLVLLQAGLTNKAFTMMRRCLHRAEALGLPMLQSLCCLGIAHALSVQPSLSDRHKRSLLWKESSAKMSTESQGATVLRTQGGAAAGAAGMPLGVAGAGSAGSRAFGYTGHSGVGGSRLEVLATLLGHTEQDESGSGLSSTTGAGTACRDALAHAALASQLSTQAGPLDESRPKVLLCQAEVARLFGLQPLTTSACGLVLEVYGADLSAENRALALCQLAAAAGQKSLASAQPLMREVARQLPYAGHLWGHIVGPQLVHILTRAGESAAASTLLFQAASVVRSVPHGSVAHAAQRLRMAANGVRLYHRQLLSAHQSAREAVESGAQQGTPGDICGHLLCLADVHLEAQNPIGALAPCLRCLSAAENSRLLQYRAEALVRIARVKLEMRDYAGALQLAEEVTPHLSASGSAQLRGDAFLVQADVLLALMARADSATCKRLLRETASVLETAVTEFESVGEVNSLRRCHYLSARVHHQLGNVPKRDVHSQRFRKISDFLAGATDRTGHRAQWADLQLPSSSPAEMNPPDVLLAHAVNGAGAKSDDVGSGGPTLHPVSSVQQPPSATPARACNGSAASQISGEVGKKCPALAQLLSLVESGSDNGGDAMVEDHARDGAPWLHSVFNSLDGGRQHLAGTQGAHMAIGHVSALYPMAAALGA